MSSKLRILIHDLGGCEGCPLSIMRAYADLKEVCEIHSKCLGNHSFDREYDIGIVTGSVCINEPRVVKEVRDLRKISKILVAYGSCASVGGITLFSRGGREPRPEHRTYLPVSFVVDVDYAIPGCPPSPNFLVNLIKMLRQGKCYFLSVFAAAAKARKRSGFDLQDEIVLQGLCIGCGACVLSCPTHALHMVDKKPDLLPEKCIRCGTCTIRCPRFTQLLVSRYRPTIKAIPAEGGGA